MLCSQRHHPQPRLTGNAKLTSASCSPITVPLLPEAALLHLRLGRLVAHRPMGSTGKHPPQSQFVVHHWHPGHLVRGYSRGWCPARVSSPYHAECACYLTNASFLLPLLLSDPWARQLPSFPLLDPSSHLPSLLPSTSCIWLPSSTPSLCKAFPDLEKSSSSPWAPQYCRASFSTHHQKAASSSHVSW